MLFLTSQFPFPADSGATIKSLGVFEYLRRRHDLRLITFTRGPLSDEQNAWAGKIGGAVTLQLDRGRTAWNLMRSYTAGVPLSIYRNQSAEMHRLAERETSDFQPDVVFVDGWLMAQYVPETFDGVKLLHQHNAEYLLWERQSQESGGPIGWLAGREAGRVRRYEAEALSRFDIVFAVSEEDRRALRQLGAEVGKLRTLPNIPQTELLELASPSFANSQPLILYFGTLSWQPNVDGLLRFLGILPFVRKSVPEAHLLVAGRGASQDLQSRVEKTNGAEFAGEIDEPEELYERARVVVDAAKTGGGTRLKILNALARGIPVVSSVEAARGLDIVPNEHLLVARNDHSFADAVITLLEDAARWRVLSENGRALIRGRYTPETAFRVLDDVLARAAPKS